MEKNVCSPPQSSLARLVSPCISSPDTRPVEGSSSASGGGSGSVASAPPSEGSRRTSTRSKSMPVRTPTPAVRSAATSSGGASGDPVAPAEGLPPAPPLPWRSGSRPPLRTQAWPANLPRPPPGPPPQRLLSEPAGGRRTESEDVGGLNLRDEVRTLRDQVAALERGLGLDEAEEGESVCGPQPCLGDGVGWGRQRNACIDFVNGV